MLGGFRGFRGSGVYEVQGLRGLGFRGLGGVGFRV